MLFASCAMQEEGILLEAVKTRPDTAVPGSGVCSPFSDTNPCSASRAAVLPVEVAAYFTPKFDASSRCVLCCFFAAGKAVGMTS